MFSRLITCLLSLVVLTSQAHSKDGKRLALLIGNQGYTNEVGALSNPHNDVNLVGDALRQLNFDVVTLRDADYRSMNTAIKRHALRVRKAGPKAISFIYYSGHGIANPDTKANYLVPVDVQHARNDDLWVNSFEQSQLLDRLNREASNATHYVVLDACRNELNVTGTAASQFKSLGSAKGFQPIQNTTGILIAYATAPGKTASDEGIGGGAYAKALAAELVRPDVEAVTMFRRVQLRVKKAINQDPWLSIPPLPEVFLAGRKTEPAHLQRPPLANQRADTQRAEKVQRLYNLIMDEVNTGRGSIDGLRNQLVKYSSRRSPKALVACIDWSKSTSYYYRPGGYYYRWSGGRKDPGSRSIAIRDAFANCRRGRCRVQNCVLVDVNGDKALEAPTTWNPAQ